MPSGKELQTRCITHDAAEHSTCAARSAVTRYLICKMHNDKGDVRHARFLEVLTAAVSIVQFLCPVLVCSLRDLQNKNRGGKQHYNRSTCILSKSSTLFIINIFIPKKNHLQHPGLKNKPCHTHSK